MVAPDGWITHEHSSHTEVEAKSLDVVQRVDLSVLLVFALGARSAVLAAYLVLRDDQDLAPSDVIGLWVMSGVVGLVTAAAILVINRASPTTRWSCWNFCR